MKTSRWLSSDSIGSWWAATIAAYCPGRMTEHLKSKSTGGFHQRHGSPCNDMNLFKVVSQVLHKFVIEGKVVTQSRRAWSRDRRMWWEREDLDPRSTRRRRRRRCWCCLDWPPRTPRKRILGTSVDKDNKVSFINQSFINSTNYFLFGGQFWYELSGIV